MKLQQNLTACSVAMLLSASVFAEPVPNPNPLVVPVDGIAQDKSTYNELAGEWWNWVTETELAGEGMVECTAGQSGKVWFLAGNQGGTTERNCTIPARELQLFFPVFNVIFWTPEDGETATAIRGGGEGFGAIDVVQAVQELTVEIDGVPVEDVFAYRAQSPAGGFLWNNAGLQESFGIEPFDRVSVADGYYILLKPLKKGQHTIRFAAAVPEFEFDLDVTYYLTISN